MSVRGGGPGATGGRGGWETKHRAAVGRGPGRGRAPTALPRHARASVLQATVGEEEAPQSGGKKAPPTPPPRPPAASLACAVAPRSATAPSSRHAPASPARCLARLPPGEAVVGPGAAGRRRSLRWPGSGGPPPPLALNASAAGWDLESLARLAREARWEGPGGSVPERTAVRVFARWGCPPQDRET